MLIQLIPGDPALTILGNHATPAKVALLHKEWGLDKPLPAQYLKFLGRLLHGDLGTSLFYGVNAGSLVWQKLPVTLFLVAFGGVLSMVLAVPLALLAATERDTASEQAVRIVPLVGFGFRAFWVGIIMLLIFALQLGRRCKVGCIGTGRGSHVCWLFLPAHPNSLAFTPIL